MYSGFVIEEIAVDDLFTKACHPYTIGLLNSLPRLDGANRKQKLETILGTPPLLLAKPENCPFMPRCKYADRNCNEIPALREVGENHWIACWKDVITEKIIV